MNIFRRITVGSLRAYPISSRRYCAQPNASTATPASDEGGASDEEEWPRRIVSGLQPTGQLHVGNYFGCVQRLVRLQDAGENLTVFVADLHALTAAAPARDLPQRTLELAACLLAAGLDPDRTVLFAQSSVPRHAELCWVLACLATHARLAQLPQYRERAAAGQERLGALLYPVLQAADVLVYRGTLVPVGADQLQHVQLAQQLVRTFHHRYGPSAFPYPKALLPEPGLGGERVRSLRRPEHKMSKSDPDGKSRILLSDSDDEIRRKIRKAVTDFTPRVTFDPESRPGVSNLVALHCLAEGKMPDEVVEENDHLTTAQYKTVVATALCSSLRGVRARALALAARPRLVRDALRAGAARARRDADRTYQAVAERVGLAAPAKPDPRLFAPGDRPKTESDTAPAKAPPAKAAAPARGEPGDRGARRSAA